MPQMPRTTTIASFMDKTVRSESAAGPRQFSVLGGAAEEEEEKLSHIPNEFSPSAAPPMIPSEFAPSAMPPREETELMKQMISMMK